MNPPAIGRFRRVQVVLAIGVCALLCALYLANLTRMGLVGPDEPRYADVGRAMASSGDWVTPRLWGEPWFEKPALLYWMTAVGFKLGLGPDLAPRLPVALLSLGFLAFFWWRVKTEWGSRIALCSTAILATSAGWLTYSEIAVTDLPLAVFFSAAVLFALPWIARGETGGLTPAAICLALATLAKGLVPLVLFAPVVVLRWRQIRDWFRPGPLLSFFIVALPWYVFCTLRNGSEFLRVFFLEHHFQRFITSDLQHVQPWWFYLAILPVLLYPWFPLLGLLRVPEIMGPGGDARLRALAAVLIFGLVFFSAAVNKLPGYLLPLLPCASILMSAGLTARRERQGILVVCLALLSLLPLAAQVAPEALAHGLRSASFPWKSAAVLFLSAAIAATFLFWLPAIHRAFTHIAFALAALGFLWFEITAFPRIDLAASARPLWMATHPGCVSPLPRATLYGLYYYSQRQLRPCAVVDLMRLPVVR